ncbi:hypothetical protein PROFUN_03244, partial [Planoprotostelium fungivorum]
FREEEEAKSGIEGAEDITEEEESMGIVEGFRESQRLRRPTTRIVLAHQSFRKAIKRRTVVRIKLRSHYRATLNFSVLCFNTMTIILPKVSNCKCYQS